MQLETNTCQDFHLLSHCDNLSLCYYFLLHIFVLAAIYLHFVCVLTVCLHLIIRAIVQLCSSD